MQPEPPRQWIPQHVPTSSQDEVAVAGRYDNYLRAQRAIRPLEVQGDGLDLEAYGLQEPTAYRHASQRMPWGPTGDMPLNVIAFPAQPGDRDDDLDLGLGDAMQGYTTRPKQELQGANDWPRGAWSDPRTTFPGTVLPDTTDGTPGTGYQGPEPPQGVGQDC